MALVEHKQISSQELFCSNENEKKYLAWHAEGGKEDVAPEWRVEKEKKKRRNSSPAFIWNFGTGLQ